MPALYSLSTLSLTSPPLSPPPQIEQDSNINDQSPHTHIANIGRMVEDMENKIRNTLNEIYFSKTKDIVNGLRSIQSLSDQKAQAAMKQDLAAALLRRNVKNDN